MRRGDIITDGVISAGIRYPKLKKNNPGFPLNPYLASYVLLPAVARSRRRCGGMTSLKQQLPSPPMRRSVYLLPIAIAAQGIQALAACQRRSSRCRRFLILALFCSFTILLVSSFQTREEPSYLDLVIDSLILESQEDSLHNSRPGGLCAGQAWIDDWISSGVMPKCSLADRTKIDILYTYNPAFTKSNLN